VVGSLSRGKSDAIEDTLDYRNIISTVQQLKTSKFALVERLATAIAESILESDCVAQSKSVKQTRHQFRLYRQNHY